MQFHNLALAIVVASSTSHGGIAAFAPPGTSTPRPLYMMHRHTVPANLNKVLFASNGQDQQEDREIKIPGKALDGIDAVEAEALRAIEAANEALKGAQVNINNSIETKDPDESALAEQRLQMELKKQKQQADAMRKKTEQKLQTDAFVSAVGGFAYGVLGGVAVDIALAANEVDIDNTVPPAVLGTGLAVAGFALGLQESQVGSTARNLFGGPVKAIANSITSAISKAVDSAVEQVKATPSKIKTAVDQKVKETTDEIKAIPRKVKDKAVETVNKTADEIKAIPEKVKDETIKAVEKTKEEIQESTQRAVEEIKATPGRVAEETKKKVIEFEKDLERQVEETLEQIEKSVEKTVDEIVSFPAKKLDELTETVSKVLPIESKPTLPIQVPKPPESPPPAAFLNEANKALEGAKQPAATQILPKIDFPQIPVPEIPKVPSPKIPTLQKSKPPEVKPVKIESNKNNTLPKVDIPKMSMSDIIPKVDFPRVPLPSPNSESSQKIVSQSSVREPMKKQPQDNFVFSEVSLKNFVKDVISEDKASDSKAKSEKRKNEELILRKRPEDEAIVNKQIAEAKMAAEKEKERQKSEANEVKRQLKESKKAQNVIDSAKPRSTISLGFLNILSSKDNQKMESATPPLQSAPIGVPTLTSWKQNADGSITGLISGSKSFRDNESVTTSPIKTKVISEQCVVITDSGSKYYLGKQATASVLFRAKPNNSKASSDEVLEKRKAEKTQRLANKLAVSEERIAEEKRAAAVRAAEENKRIAEEKRAAAVRAAEESKRIAEEKRAAAVRAAQERKAAAEESKRIAEEKRAAAVQATEEKKRLAEEKRMRALEAVTKQKQEEDKRRERALQMRKSKTVTANLNEAKQAEEIISTAKKGATVSLGFLGFGSQKVQDVDEAPRGVPTINKWTKNSDGSVTGQISGSKAFDEGESITTSPLTSDPSEGSIVTTASGSKYFLKSKSKGLFASGSEPPMSSSTLEVKGRRGSNEASLQEKSEQVVTSANPRATISLDFFNFGPSYEEKSDVAMPQPKIVSRAPRGIPTLTNWKSNRDGSVTGSILDSRAYNDGEIVTTSPLTTASADGALVQTSSGSRYFLAPNVSSRDTKQAGLEKKRAAQQAAAEAKKADLEEKRAAQQAAAEAKKAELEEKRAAQQAAVEAKKAELKKKNSLIQNREDSRRRLDAAKSDKALSIAKSGSTISLGFLKFGTSSEDAEIPSTGNERLPVIVGKAPNGVPTLSNWRRNRDGSITGLISGSKAFGEGESITTSTIVSGISDGALVQTSSGSKYFLAPKKSSQNSSVIQKMAPPKGVPKLISWRKNRDSSITGFISGSPNFDEGEKITTSPITSGSIEEGQVVRTGSGSSYYLV